MSPQFVATRTAIVLPVTAATSSVEGLLSCEVVPGTPGGAVHPAARASLGSAAVLAVLLGVSVAEPEPPPTVLAMTTNSATTATITAVTIAACRLRFASAAFSASRTCCRS